MNFKLILRTLWKDRFYTLLNILGLAVGIAMVLLTFLYIQSELTYDLHYSQNERIYRVGTRFERSNEIDQYALSGSGMAELIQAEYPEIEKATSITFRSQRLLYRYGEKSFYLDDVLTADSMVFEIFDPEFIVGNPETAMDGPDKLVLQASVARRFFGDEDPLGKIIRMNERDLEVTGVFKDLPENTHLKYSGLISRPRDPQTDEYSVGRRLWMVGRYTYILLQKGSTIESIEAKLQTFVDKYSNQEGADQFLVKPIFEPLAAIHFQSDLPYDQPHGNMNYIYAFFVVGCLILLLAAINYINLTTARAANRAKEVGIKKVVGVSRWELIAFFLGESLVITLLAMLLALSLVHLLFQLPSISLLLDKNLTLDLWSNPVLAPGILVLTLVLSFLAGIYPAFYLSGLQPIGTLKGTFKTSRSGLLLRRVLVVFQFVISIGVVTLTLLMIQQIDFLRNKDLGFQKENLMTIPLSSQALRNKMALISDALRNHPQVLGVSSAQQVPGLKTDRLNREIDTPSGLQSETFNYLVVGYDYLETMQMDVVAGRDFARERGTDGEEAWIVNEAFAKHYGWEDPLGKRFL
ncbi:MAG: ABC transporter permease, partial [Bacteroidota bacterium]